MDDQDSSPLLPQAAVVAILAKQGETCSERSICYYPNVSILAAQLRSSRCWAMGEVFVYAPTPDRYLVIKQVAPSSCEMLTVTAAGTADVLTAYRYEQDELVALLETYLAAEQKVVSIAAGSSAFNRREVGASHNSGDTFGYQLLARLKQDCEYYLGHGNRAKKHLWADDEAEQIAKMKALYAGFSEKPEWISLEDIEQYEAKMLYGIGCPTEEWQDEADAPKNVLGQVAAKPFYIWANDDCANKSDSFSEAKTIRLALFNEGGESVHIVDADGVEVVDAEIECHESLANSGYFAGARKPEVKPGIAGAYIVNDSRDPDGFAIVGDDVGALILEAQAQLIHPDD